MAEIIECVVNISEGKDQNIIDQISSSITSVRGTKLLHVDIGYDANRTVFTFVADRINMRFSILSMFKKTLALINMQNHHGEHPRIGAIDVCPFIPISDIYKEELIKWTYLLAKEISDYFHLPIYLYEDSAIVVEHKNLSYIRKGNYEGLKNRLASGKNIPDFGHQYDSTYCGATVMGVRSFLLAYNINLMTKDPEIANEIAKKIRGSGYKTKDGIRQKGMFPTVKAIGWYMDEYACAQVSTNLTDYHSTCFHDIYEACKRLAQEYNTEVNGSELIGLTPLDAILYSGIYYGGHQLNEEELIKSAIHHLGLSSLMTFLPHQRIIDFMLL